MKDYSDIKPVYGLRQITDVYIPRPRLGHSFKMQIRPGCYNTDYTISEESIPNPMPLDIDSDDLLVFRGDAVDSIREQIKDFWSEDSRSICKDAGLLHKRGLLINGPPGSGKSSLIKQEIKNLVDHGQIVFIGNSPYGLREAMHAFRRMEPDRELTVVIEDIDEVSRCYGDHAMIQILDGPDSIDEVLFIATTNNMEVLSRKMKRPGRFDRRINLPYPTLEQRVEYLSKKTNGKVDQKRIDRMGKLTDGFSFGHLRVLLTDVCGHGCDLKETVTRLREELAEDMGNIGSKDNAIFGGPK